MIENNQQLKIAPRAVENLQHVLLAARKVHSHQEYRLMSAPILLEIQRRDQEILAYLSRTEMEAVQGQVEVERQHLTKGFQAASPKGSRV